jgi:hypothetical protein
MPLIPALFFSFEHLCRLLHVIPFLSVPDRFFHGRSPCQPRHVGIQSETICEFGLIRVGVDNQPE